MITAAVSSPSRVAPNVPRESDVPVAMAIPGVHDLVFEVVQRYVPPDTSSHVLDLGAGMGAFSLKLRHAGYRVSACDMFPELFRCPGVECREADVQQSLPYADDSLDAVVALEVVEHLETQLGMFREIERVLRPGGKFLFSTPNIMSLKSRLRFLLTGYLYSHGPLDPTVYDPVGQHVAPFSPDRYQFMLARSGMALTNIEAEKYQKSSLWLSWLSPVVRMCARKMFGDTAGVRMQNCPAALLGRTMIGVAQKPAITE